MRGQSLAERRYELLRNCDAMPRNCIDPNRNGNAQIWMAKNLNYETDGSFCYKNADSKCTQYGRLYKWDAAKKACPSGWHLPSKKDFETMLSTLGVLETGAPQPNDAPLKPQGKESGWNYTGTNSSGFTALPAGYRDDEGHYVQENERAEFWTSTEYNTSFAIGIRINASLATIDHQDGKYEGRSVRCIKD